MKNQIDSDIIKNNRVTDQVPHDTSSGDDKEHGTKKRAYKSIEKVYHQENSVPKKNVTTKFTLNSQTSKNLNLADNDLILPKLLSLLKENTCNLSCLLKLSENDIHKSKDLPAKIKKYFDITLQCNNQMDDILSGLEKYLSFMLHIPGIIENDLQQILSVVLDELENVCKNESYKIHVSLPNMFLATDPEAITFIFTAIFKNCISRKNPSQDKINIHLYAKKNLSGTIFEIQDNGNAIDEDDKKYLFNLFDGRDFLRSNKIEVALASQYIRMLDGSIWLVQSKPTKTIFRFFLPSQHCLKFSTNQPHEQ